VAVGGILSVVDWGISSPLERARQIKHDANINIIDLQQRKIVKTIRADAVGPLAWSPEGARLALVGGPKVQIFDTRSGESLVNATIEKSGNMNVRFTSDGRYLIESDLNGMGNGLGVNIWDSQRHALLQHIPGDIGSIAVSHDGKYFAVGATGRTTIWQFK
jgi:WD40 repeat protein